MINYIEDHFKRRQEEEDSLMNRMYKPQYRLCHSSDDKIFYLHDMEMPVRYASIINAITVNSLIAKGFLKDLGFEVVLDQKAGKKRVS